MVTKKFSDVSATDNSSNGGSGFGGGSSQGHSPDEGKENEDSDCRSRCDRRKGLVQGPMDVRFKRLGKKHLALKGLYSINPP